MKEKIKTAKEFINKPEHKPNFQVTATDGKTYWISRSVAVLAIVLAKTPDGWKILVNRRGDGTPDYQGYWNIPCGYVDFGETCEEAASREIFEECGVKIDSHAFRLFAVESDPMTSNKQNITIRYITYMPSEFVSTALSASNSEYHEVDDIRWVNLNDINDYEWAFNHKSILTDVIVPETRNM